MAYLWYFDDSKKPIAQKIAEGCAAYAARWGATAEERTI